MVCKNYILINSNLLLTKTENRTIANTAPIVPFLTKNANFLQNKKKKNDDINKVKKVLVLKGVFSETTYVCVPTNQIF